MKKRIFTTLCFILFVTIASYAQNNFFEANVSPKWDDPLNWSLGHPATGAETAMIDGVTCWVNVEIDEPDVFINAYSGAELLVLEDANFSKIQVFDEGSYLEIPSGITLQLNTDGSVSAPLHLDEGADMINDGTIYTYSFMVGQFAPYTCNIENSGTIDFNGTIFGTRLSMGICEFRNYGTLTCGTIGSYDFLFCNGTTNEFYNYGTITKTGIDENAIHMKGLFENHGTIDILSEGFTANAKPTIVNVGEFHNYGDISIDVDPGDADGIADEGIECISSPFTNHSGATITVKNTYLYGLSPLDAPGSTNLFTNHGTVTVSDIHGGGYAIYGTGTYRCEGLSQLDGNVFSQVDVEFDGCNLAPGTSPGEIIFLDDQDFDACKYICEIEGTGGPAIDHDHIEVQGDCDLSLADLSVSLISGFSPVAGDEFVVLSTSNGGSLNGTTYSTVTLPSIGSLIWEVEYSSTEVKLKVIAPSSANNFFEANIDDTWSDPLNWSLGHVPYDQETAFVGGLLLDIDVPVNEPGVWLNAYSSAEIFVNYDAEFSRIRVFDEGSYLEIANDINVTVNLDGSVTDPFHVDQGADMANYGQIYTYDLLIGQFSPYTCVVDNFGTIDFNGSIFGNRLSMGICIFTNHGTLTCGDIGAYDFLYCNGTANEFYNFGTITKTGTGENAIHMKGLIENHGTIDILHEGFAGNEHSIIINVGDFHNYGDISVDVDPSDSDGVAGKGLYNISKPFTNHVGANLSIKNVYDYGLYITDGAGQLNPFINQGIVTINNVSGDGHALYGTGTYRCEGDSNMEGSVFQQITVEFDGCRLSPGTSPGQVTFLDDQDFDGVEYACEIQGTGGAGIDHDFLEIQGTASLSGGTVDVMLINGFVPSLGDSFTILSTTNGGIIDPSASTFDSFDLPTLPSDLEWEITYTTNDVILSVIEFVPCNLPPELNFVENLTGTSTRLHWFEVLGADKYRIQYRIVGNPDWLLKSNSNLVVTLTDLIPNTDYEFRFASRCGSWGDYGEIYNFTSSECVPPETDFTESLSGYIQKITLVEVPDAIKYQVRYRPLAGGGWKLKNFNGGDLSKNLINLMPATEYEFEKRTRCSSGFYTPFGEPDFFTTSSCESPDPIIVSFPSSSEATVEWTDQENAINYQIRYRPAGDPNWTTKSSSTPIKTLTGLNTTTNYIYQLRAKCPSWTPWSSNHNFMTPSIGGEIEIDSRSNDSDFMIYPNPASTGEIYISIGNISLEQSVLEIYDMKGSLVSRSTNLNEDQGISVHHLNPGQYIAKLQTAEFHKTTRFIIAK